MSFVVVEPNSDFPIQNLPYGVFRRKGTNESGRIGVAIGSEILDLAVLADAGGFSGPLMQKHTKVFHEPVLNSLMALGKPHWHETRESITKILSKDEPFLRDNVSLRQQALVPQSSVEMLLPANIGDYTDFYASKEHATNVGIMFRGKDNALLPNWLQIPIGYHGRSSSIVVSETPVRRPRGQLKPNEQDPPIFGPSKVVDFEIEMAWFIGPGNNMGDPLTMSNVEDHMFGMVIMNDWSARDIQKWEYVPLGPFGAKNWGTTISPWVVPFEALEPFRTSGPEQNPTPLPYLQEKTSGATFDVQISAAIKTLKATKPQVISNTNLKYMYWNMKQQTVHHTITGCNMRPGDLLATGTISGPARENWGSLLEISWQGTTPISITETGETRKFIDDGDIITFHAHCEGKDYRIGFGECSGQLLPAHTN